MEIPFVFGCAVLLVVAGCKSATESVRSETPTNQSSGTFPGHSARSPALPFSGWAKVRIKATGAIFVNKKQVTTEQFMAECDRLKKVGGGILVFLDGFDREDGPPRVDALGYPAAIELPVTFVFKESELE